MENPAKLDVEKLISYSDVLIQSLKTDRDGILLNQCSQQLRELRSQCEIDHNHVLSSIEEYEKKIDMCRQKIAMAESETAADQETDMLQKELEDESKKERLLREELRVTTDEIDGLELQTVSLEERRQVLKKLEQDDLRTEMKLSMYASVTRIIPNLDDQSKISGYMVEKEKKEVEKFELDPNVQDPLQTCNHLWKMINF